MHKSASFYKNIANYTPSTNIWSMAIKDEGQCSDILKVMDCLFENSYHFSILTLYFVTCYTQHCSLTHVFTVLWVLPMSSMKSWICCIRIWKSNMSAWESTSYLTPKKFLQRNSLAISTLLETCSWCVLCEWPDSSLIHFK